MKLEAKSRLNSRDMVTSAKGDAANLKSALLGLYQYISKAEAVAKKEYSKGALSPQTRAAIMKDVGGALRTSLSPIVKKLGLNHVNLGRESIHGKFTIALYCAGLGGSIHFSWVVPAPGVSKDSSFLIRLRGNSTDFKCTRDSSSMLTSKEAYTSMIEKFIKYFEKNGFGGDGAPSKTAPTEKEEFKSGAYDATADWDYNEEVSFSEEMSGKAPLSMNDYVARMKPNFPKASDAYLRGYITKVSQLDKVPVPK